MNSEQMSKSWNRMSGEILSGIAEWRQQHPEATFRELEEEGRLSGFDRPDEANGHS